MASSAEITRMLRAWSAGDGTVLDDLMPIVYDQLCSIAAKYFRSERSSTLQTTAIVHEAFLRLAGSEVEWNDRVHFFAVASRTMRRILVDHARARQRVRRGGGEVALSLDESLTVSKGPDRQVVELDAALVSLAKFDLRKSEILEMFYFGGMTYAEIAGATDVSEATVHRELKLAKAWLRQELNAMPEVSVSEVHPEL